MKQDVDLNRAARQYLRDFSLAGLSEIAATVPSEDAIAALTSELASLAGTQSPVRAPLVTPTPVATSWQGDHPQPMSAVPVQTPVPAIQTRTPMPKVKRTSNSQTVTVELANWATTVAACTRCRELASTRTQTVFGVGNPTARVMFIGEAPGADEDAQGEPFVGRAGQLLNKIIAACGWKREELYICNILRCRPPGNRNPLPAEAANCREYLDAQIDLVQPEYIVCWGTIAAQNLLGLTEPISKLRKRFFDYKSARVLCTYHPSYLLRNPSAKKDVWEDLQMMLVDMGIDLESLPKPVK